MKIEIKARFCASSLFSHDVEDNSMRITLEKAIQAGTDLGSADLRGADLRGADLGSADLRDADLGSVSSLWGASGNLREVKSMQCDHWPVTYTATHMQIGCQLHALSDWWAFDDESISNMDRSALVWWRKWKPLLHSIIEASPAVMYGVKEEEAEA